MRLFEGLVVASFLPMLLRPLVPRRWPRWWAATLPGLVVMLHLVVEGWRVQLVLLYVLALVIPARGLIFQRRRAGNVRRGRDALGRSGLALSLLGCSALAGWLLPVVRLPPPSGPHPVGFVDREISDPAHLRRLMVSVYYPAAQRGPATPLIHDPDLVIPGMAAHFGIPALALHHLRYLTVATSEGVPVAATNTAFPVLVMSHGMGGLRIQNSTTAQELASWGYIVVALEHTDGAALTVFPNGEARRFDLGRFGIGAVDPAQLMTLVEQRMFPMWVADQRLVYDALEDWTKNDPLLAGTLDVTRVGSFGHSFGGATALEVCRVEPRCRAAGNLDGGLYGAMRTQPTVRPLLLLSSTESTQNATAVTEWQQMIARATTAATWLELPGSTHLSFTITPLLSPVLAGPHGDPRNALRITDRYVRAFFDIHLRGADPQRLQPTSEATEVRWIASRPEGMR